MLVVKSMFWGGGGELLEKGNAWKEIEARERRI